MARHSLQLTICLAAALLAGEAQAQSDASRIMERMRTGNTQGTAPSPPPAADKPIAAAPIPVTIKKWGGQKKAFEIFPGRVVVAGYNVGGFRTAKTTGRASGGILNSNPGASSTVELVAWGIDQPLLTRIANAAYADLNAQLQAAGFEVVSLEQARAAAGFDKLKLGSAPYEVSVPADRGKMEGTVVGPALTGVRGNFPLAKVEFGSFGAPVLSLNLESMVVMPNLMFDFAALSSSRSMGYTASAAAELRFGIAQGYSQFRVMASRRKEFLEGDFIYAIDSAQIPDTPIGRIGDANRSDNGMQQALGRALGAPMQARSKSSSVAEIDQARYEAMALAAARGWNAAFVAQLRTATGR